MNILQKIRTKASQALTGVGNFIDRDKSMGGIQLAKGGLMNRIADTQVGGHRLADQVKAYPEAFAQNLPVTPERQQNFNRNVGDIFGEKSAPTTVAQGFNNWLSAPLMQVPYNLKETVAPDKTKLERVGSAANAAFGLLPGVDDALFAGYNALKTGAAKRQTDAKGGFQTGLAGNEYTGLGDAVTGGKEGTATDLLNVAELPLILFGGLKAGGVKNVDQAAKNLDNLGDTLKNSDTVVKEVIEKAPKVVKGAVKSADNVDEVVEQTVKAIRKPREVFENWVNTREGLTQWKAGDIKKNPFLTAFDDEGLEAIKELQTGTNPTKFTEIKRYTDELFNMEKNAGIVTPDKYRQNYLPQMWDNTMDEINQVFGKTVGKDPGFTKNRIFQDYAAGIEAGLTPRFTRISDLLEARFKTAQRALADKEFVDTLVDTGNAYTLDKAPKGWKTVADLTQDGKPLAVNPEIAGKIANYTMEGSELLKKTANFVAETKQTLLSAGIPRTGLNFHTGVNIPTRAMMGRKNPFGAAIDSTLWNFNPKSAEKAIEKIPNDIKEGLIRGGLTVTRSSDAADYGFKPAQGEGAIKAARNWIDKAFSEVAFDTILPAHKFKYGEEVYNRAIKQGMTPDQAFKVAATTANELFGGINTQALGRNKDLQNVLRTFFLAPDWLETNIKVGAKTGASLLNPKNWSDKSLAPYRRVALNAASMYLSMAMVNKALSGKFPWENGAGQEFNLATGTYDERGRERMIPMFGTAFDAFRIPYTVISGIAQNDPQAITNVVKNRLSPIVGAGVALASNSDYRGREITSPDKSPLENVLGIGGQVATAVGVPSQATNLLRFASGASTGEELAAGLLEAPLRYYGGANTEAKKDQAKNLKNAGLSNKEVNQALTTKRESGGLLNWLGGGKVSAPPTGASKKERDAYNKSIDAAMEAGSTPEKEALAYRYFDNKSASSESVEERMDVYKSLNKVMEDEYLTDEQKAAVVAASGADPKDAEYYTLASKDQDVRLQEMLPKLDNMDDTQMLEFLTQGRRAIGGKQLVSNTMIDYLYENDYISDGERKALKAIKYDEIKNKFYISKSYKGGNSLTYKQALELFEVPLPKFSTMKSVENLLAQYSGGTQQTRQQGEILLTDILSNAPVQKNRNNQLWF